MSSIRVEAERITSEVAKVCGCVWASCTKTRNAIEQALRARDKRAVKIIEDHQAQDKCEDNCWTTVKAAILKED